MSGKTYHTAVLLRGGPVRGHREPAAMGYCHCESCRHWSAGPVNAFTLWKPDAVKVTHGADSIGTFNKTPNSYRKWCTKCGGHLFTDHPTMGLVDVYAALLPELRFEPGLHVNYQETRAADQGRPAEDEGHAQGDGRLGRHAAGVGKTEAAGPAGGLADTPALQRAQEIDQVL